MKTVKYLCDLCGKEIENHPSYGLMGSAFMVDEMISTKKRIDLCDKCRDLIRKNGYIEKGEEK